MGTIITDGYPKENQILLDEISCTYIQEPDYQRTCPSGYTLSVNNCYKLEYDVETIAVTKNYICSSEYTLSGDKCQKEISVLANEVYTCPQNYTLKGATCYSD